jgi:hypothetical protein
MKVKKFKIRASAIGNIMAGSIGLTENQELKYKELCKKEKLTENQSKEKISLKVKKNNPELPEGTKTHCRNWLKGQILNRRRDISNKFTEKGNIMEDESIDFIAKMLNYGMLIKNEEYFNNNYIEGTPDILVGSDEVIDAKNSWSHETFPLLETTPTTNDYYWQGQGYLDLTNRTHFKLIYVLSDTPEHLIERQARQYCINNGYEELDMEIYQRFLDDMTYDDIEDKYKIKSFYYERNDSDIQAIYKRVKLCRKYIKTLIESYL